MNLYKTHEDITWGGSNISVLTTYSFKPRDIVIDILNTKSLFLSKRKKEAFYHFHTTVKHVE